MGCGISLAFASHQAASRFKHSKCSRFFKYGTPMDHFTPSYTPYCSYSLSNKRLAEASSWNGIKKKIFPSPIFYVPGLREENGKNTVRLGLDVKENVSENKFLLFWHFSYFRFYTFSNFMLRFAHNKIENNVNQNQCYGYILSDGGLFRAITIRWLCV